MGGNLGAKMTLMMSLCAGLALGAASGVATGQSLAVAQHRSVAVIYSVYGTVADHDGHALPDAEIAVVQHDSAVRLVRTDTAGRFEMHDLTASKVTLRIRRLGFKPRRVDVNLSGDEGHHALIIELDVMPAELAAMSVNEMADEPDAKLREYYARKQSNNFGHYIDGEQIERRHPQYASEMLRGVLGATLLPGRIGYRVRIRGCSPLVWLDGVRVPGAQLDEVVQPAEVAAMEIYDSFAGIPAQYFDRSATCGTILVWTRAR